MEFISTKGMTNETAPEGQCLVQYLEPSWGFWNVEYAIGYFDNPKHYTGGSGDGWKHWHTENKINVLAYAIFPEPLESEFTAVSQKEFKERFGTSHPNLGSIGA